MGRRGAWRSILLATTFLVTFELPEAGAQQLAQAGGDNRLPTVRVNPPPQAKKQKQRQVRPRVTPPPQPAPQEPGVNTANTQAGRSGTVGYVTQRISTGTRTETPIINIPQSISVVTQELHPRPEQPGHDGDAALRARRHPASG